MRKPWTCISHFYLSLQLLYLRLVRVDGQAKLDGLNVIYNNRQKGMKHVVVFGVVSDCAPKVGSC